MLERKWPESESAFANRQLMQVMAAVMFFLLPMMTWAAEPTALATGSTSTEDGTDKAPWKFRVTPFAWAPSEVDFHVKDGPVNEHLNLSLDDLAGAMEGAAEFRAEVHKGRFGAFVSTIYMELNGNTGDAIKIDVDDSVYFWFYGVSYALEPWHFGETVVTVEPFVGGRTLRDSIRLNTQGVDREVELEFTTPVVGVTASADFNERWNIFLEADYGGFDVNVQWNAEAGVGYRFHIRSQPLNLLVGYRKWFLDYEKGGAELDINAHGPIVGLAFDF
jgi:hypothetical protein